MWGQSVPHRLHHGSLEVFQPRQAALQELLEIFPDDRPAMLQVAGERGNWRQVLALHQQAVGQIPPEDKGELYRDTALQLVNAEQWKRALQMIEDFRKQCESPREFWSSGGKSIGSLMLYIYSRQGTWQEILQTLREGQTYPDSVLPQDRSDALMALATQDWQRALEVIGDGKDDDTDKGTILAGMYAWSSGGQWQNIFELLHGMERRRPDQVDMEVFEGAMSACYQVVRSNEKQAAPAAAAMSGLARDVRRRGMNPSEDLWSMATLLHLAMISLEGFAHLCLHIGIFVYI